jgi:hypothetical protein
MSSLHAPEPRTIGDRAAALLRQGSGQRLGREAARVRATGTDVVLIQPAIQDLDAMGTNLMSRSRRSEVTEVAVETVTAHLRTDQMRARLHALPPGAPDLVRRPPGTPHERPAFAELARARWAEGAPAARAVAS